MKTKFGVPALAGERGRGGQLKLELQTVVRLILVATIFSGVLFSCSSRIERTAVANSVETAGVNINTATVEQLEKLPHIGRKTAESIIEFRSVNGPFRRVEHLMQIRGISEERFRELRPFIKTE